MAKRFITSLFFIAGILAFLPYPTANASPLSQAYLQLDRSKITSSLSGTVCAKPSSEGAGTENSVSVTFPSDFTINTTLSNWTTNTENLPPGAVAWPHIGSNASTISTQTVSFSSGDLLSASSLYCFNFESNGSTTSKTTGAKTATITTADSANTPIDSKKVSLSIIKDDQVSVRATVKERSSDLLFDIQQVTPGTSFQQYTTLEYTITYGTNLAFAVPVIIEASWKDGDIQGAPGSTVGVLEYVNKSAGLAYGDTAPTIDLVNKKIIWNIPSFPARKKDHTVSFKLKTNAIYTGNRTVTSQVVARMITNYASLDKSVATNYLYNPGYKATPAEPIVVKLRTVSADRATILVQTLDDANLRVLYGTDASDLTLGASTLQNAREQIIVLNNLIPDTTFYFTVTAATADGATIESDTYMFHTARISVAPQVDRQTLMFMSSDIILSDATDQTYDSPSFNIPQGTNYNFRFKLNRYETVKEVEGSVRSTTVLGINNEEVIEPTNNNTTLFERQPGVFEGRLKSADIPGTYELYLKVSDNSGNIVENKLARVLVSKRLTVNNKEDGKPIEGAQILLSYQNLRTHTFDILPEQIIPIKNPSYTDSFGQINYPLPAGTYKAQIVAIGFHAQTITFTIGPNSGEEYPTVALVKQPFNLVTYGLYYQTILMDVANSFRTYIQKLATSLRFFELNAMVAIADLVFLTLLSFSSRLRIPLHSLVDYLLHQAKIATIHKKLGARIKGRIFDEQTGHTLGLADIFLIDAENNKVVGHTQTNLNGDFNLLKYQDRAYKLDVLKDGYEPITFHESEIEAGELGGYLLSIHKRDLGPTIGEKTALVTEKILSLLFETLLVGSIISETAFGFALGWQKAAPFLAVSLINVGMWILHLTHLRSEKNIF